MRWCGSVGKNVGDAPRGQLVGAPIRPSILCGRWEKDEQIRLDDLSTISVYLSDLQHVPNLVIWLWKMGLGYSENKTKILVVHHKAMEDMTKAPPFSFIYYFTGVADIHLFHSIIGIVSFDVFSSLF